MPVNSQSLVLPVSVQNDLIKASSQASVVQQQVKQVPVGQEGSQTYYVGNAQPTWVREGATKQESTPEISPIRLLPRKTAAIVVVTQEFKNANEFIAEQLVNDIPASFGTQFDVAATGNANATGTGLVLDPQAAYPGGEPVFYNNMFTAGQTTTATTASFSFDLLLDFLSRAEGGEILSKRATTWYVTRSFLYELLRLKDAQGRYLLDNLNGTVTNLLGRPVKIIEGANKMAILSDDNGSRWGIVGGITVRTDTSGIVVDTQGVEHNLFQQNKIAYLAEAQYAFATASRFTSKLILA